MSHEILFLILGAIVGLLLTLLWEEILKNRKLKSYGKSYAKYEGIYLAFSKYDNSEDTALKYLEIVRDKNCFNIVQGISLSGNEDFTGRITMSETIHNYGNGYYQHTRDKNNIIRFGFLEVQLTPNEILVHETIYNEKGAQNSDGYRWVKQDPNKRNDILERCRERQQEKSKSR